jgi:hypothetical protein
VDICCENEELGHRVTVSLTTGCHITAGAIGPLDADSSSSGECARAPSRIIDDCLTIFADRNDPAALTCADLTGDLRELPGLAEDRRPYADLTQPRLARLLAAHGICSQDITGPGGRCYQSYRRSALLAAITGGFC